MLVKNSVGGRVEKYINSKKVDFDSDMLFMIHGDNSASILINQRKINRIKLTDRAMYDRLNERGNGYYTLNYETDNNETLTILRTEAHSFGMDTVDLSQCDYIDIDIQFHLTPDEYINKRSKEPSNDKLMELLNSFLNIKD